METQLAGMATFVSAVQSRKAPSAMAETPSPKETVARRGLLPKVSAPIVVTEPGTETAVRVAWFCKAPGAMPATPCGISSAPFGVEVKPVTTGSTLSSE